MSLRCGELPVRVPAHSCSRPLTQEVLRNATGPTVGQRINHFGHSLDPAEHLQRRMFSKSSVQSHGKGFGTLLAKPACHTGSTARSGKPSRPKLSNNLLPPGQVSCIFIAAPTFEPNHA